MKFNRYILASFAALALAPGFVSCSDDDDFTETIFPDVPTAADPSSATYQFDTWLIRNFRDVYNLEFCYKMEDVETDMNYNLVPASFDKARDLALLTRYLWFDVYDVVTRKSDDDTKGKEFLKQYGPRIIHLIGSPAYNPSTGTEILGLAEGGIKVSLFKVNELDINDFNQLNEYYFRTMHHEFAHILHQTKSYPTEFNTLSSGRYDDNNWQDRNNGIVTSLGFITSYGSSQNREDFAETIANYITRTDEQYDLLLWCADQNWYSGDDTTDQSMAYCYYYYASDADREANKRTYTLQFIDDKSQNLMTLVDNTGGVHASVAEVEAYLAKMGEKYTMYQYEISDGVDGRAIINQKVNIARNWLKDEWDGLDLDRLRDTVQVRQMRVNEAFMDSVLRPEVDNIQ